MKKLSFFLFAFLCFKSFAQNLNSISEASLKKAIGYDISNFKIYSYPTNNFGVGTTCKRKWNLNDNIACDMVKTFGLSDLPDTSKKWRDVNGYAYFGNGGPITEKDSINKIYGLGLLLPKILKILNIDLGGGIENTKSISLTIDSARKRFLIYDNYINYVKSQPKDSRIYSSWNANHLVVATADFVLLGYSLYIKKNDSFGIRLNAKLDSVLNVSKSLTFDKDSLGFQIKKSKDGIYSIGSSRPVVFAIYVQKQRKLEKNATETDFNNWDVASEAEIVESESTRQK
jgi:hypothetical protein